MAAIIGRPEIIDASHHSGYRDPRNVDFHNWAVAYPEAEVVLRKIDLRSEDTKTLQIDRIARGLDISKGYAESVDRSYQSFPEADGTGCLLERWGSPRRGGTFEQSTIRGWRHSSSMPSSPEL
jgi:hypothetical protein